LAPLIGLGCGADRPSPGGGAPADEATSTHDVPQDNVRAGDDVAATDVAAADAGANHGAFDGGTDVSPVRLCIKSDASRDFIGADQPEHDAMFGVQPTLIGKYIRSMLVAWQGVAFRNGKLYIALSDVVVTIDDAGVITPFGQLPESLGFGGGLAF